MVAHRSLADEMDLLAPSYYGNDGDPPDEWSALEQLYVNNGLHNMIILNEDNGPGTSYDETLAGNISDMQTNWFDNQVRYLGYVLMPANYDANNNASFGRTTADVLTDVNNWRWYGPVNNMVGIFFDEVERLSPNSDPYAWSSADLPQIEYVASQLVATTPFRTIVMNAAGAYTTTQGLFYCVNQILAGTGAQFIVVTLETYESAAGDNISTHASDFDVGGALNWTHHYPATGFAGLVHDATAAGVFNDLQAFANYNMAFGFVTDQTYYPNAWEPGPSPAVWNALGGNTGIDRSWTFAGDNSGGLNFTCPTPHS
jgi:hypothetical protein